MYDGFKSGQEEPRRMRIRFQQSFCTPAILLVPWFGGSTQNLPLANTARTFANGSRPTSIRIVLAVIKFWIPAMKQRTTTSYAGAATFSLSCTHISSKNWRRRCLERIGSEHASSTCSVSQRLGHHMSSKFSEESSWRQDSAIRRAVLVLSPSV